MARNGLLIDFEFCTGCGTCEVACKTWNNIPVGKWGIKIFRDGPWEIENDEWNYNFIPYPTDMCDLCVNRLKEGKDPACVHNCLAQCIEHGPVDELSKKLDFKGKQVLFVPKDR